ncbi:anthranilate phosphoribosyltransferase [Pelagibacterium halotolerans]|uniref:Anthranilate phosphoribosyltransferase n=1 Tax=Pelagibacterium halotolerans (strain DSM 22347 / JCM 15775 / CGMCC 1.7692 / B2) TaxID=1082931 RepID=G4R8X7_PELHB|nr:anthranilate phosphoribosyltransferase [Pelagibacterium halotolerans]AEQ51394.1 anthranilate phosphoribosyltransferase [Pelagibacterium halotolerans B2]QJR18763.1 anthranilate phosphoribosyltransferase [Pelagibacterium halotolerans]SEA12245.1 anthranilate phosphoribosyltransferase [Pelagibacterium halotolerans]
MDIKGALNRIADGKDLTGTEMRQVMDIIMSGEATASQTGAFLMGMRVKGETVGEIAAAVSIMRNKMVPVEAPEDAIDIVGTGGDGAGTLNISTGASIVVAAAGVPVAKHGNRALSSKSGSAEALQKLGISLDLSPERISACIREAGIGFMFAPNHHPAMRHVGPTRAEMGVRTMFNLLGPQSNPAGVKRYLLGVFDNEWVEPVAAALLANQAQAAWVVHGDSGLDELSTTGPSFVSQIKNGNLTSFEVTPEDAGLPRAKLDDIVGGDPEHNAGELRKLLEGAKGAYRDIVLLNAAAAFIIADKVRTLPEGVAMGAEAIDSGKAKATLDKLIAVSGAQ